VGDIFREVDEELKQERYEKLWRLYGKYIIGAAVLLVAAVAGWKAWQSHQTSQRLAEGERFAAGSELLLDGKSTEAYQVFAGISADTRSGYGILAKFYEASIVAGGDDPAKSISIYDAIAAESSAPPSLRDLAKILGALQGLRSSTIDSKIIADRVRPMSGAGKTYRHVALEIMALAAMKSGATEVARGHYREIVDDPAAARGIRTRAAQILNILGES
jgi:hypothetical protein